MFMSGRKYLNFTTPHGVSMAAFAQSGLSAFLIHETGYLDPVSHWNHEGVDSPFWRFYYNPKAGCFLRHAGRTIPLQADRVVLIPANTVFDCCGPVDAEHFWIHFTVNHHSHIRVRGPQVVAVDATLKALLNDALNLCRGTRQALHTQRLYHLSAALLHTSFSRLEQPLASELPTALVDLLALIDKAPHSDLNNLFLATRAHMGVEKFIRWFRSHLGQTPAAYVSESRVRQARQLLALSDKSIDQIAIETGFPNRHYFSRVFARLVGCGPAEFRLRQRVRKGR